MFDATCPLVTKVHRGVQKQARAGLPIVLIGHADTVFDPGFLERLAAVLSRAAAERTVVLVVGAGDRRGSRTG